MTILWIEPFGGIAGDMLLGALLDLGDARFGLEDLRALAEELVPGAARLASEEVWRGSLRGRALDVRTPETDAQPHRGLADLAARLEASSLPARARERAVAALTELARAEARVHGCAPEEVHFHEVGAVDTLIDVGGAALALERLGVDEVRASRPLVGSGVVRCAHGEMPVPAPAVAELLRGRPYLTGGGRERTTPTGAALLVAWTASFDPPADFVADAIGYGAGGSDPREGPPNLVRVQLGREISEREDVQRHEAWLLEANLDDQPAEEIGHAVGELRAAGALEVWTVAVQMKKDRPGAIVCALARPGSRAALEECLFAWTSTFGVRWTRLERRECGRRTIEVELAGAAAGRVRVKVRERPLAEGAAVGAAVGERDLFPEHDDLAALAARSGATLGELRRAAIAAALAAERADLPGPQSSRT